MESFSQEYILPWAINIATAIAIFVIGRWVVKLLMKVLESLLHKTKMDTMLVNFVSSIANALLLLFVVIAALGQLGVDTTSLIALIGAAGLAIGLSLQDSLKNFAAGVMLIVFRPFREGDFVEAGGVSGIVESITIFNSVFRTGDNREIILPNGKIYSDKIVNYSKRETRRVDMVFGIGYNDDLLKAKRILQEILEQDERVLAEPEPSVRVAELADSSVNFNVRPWVKNGDYWPVLWDTTEKVKLEFDRQGISIPYPQMDVHVHKQPDTDAKG
ncbi:mechanosensitive ion channel family protein [Marinobacterium marinum]|uniref:Small-conductance mechanosensitive channel n=1 Tax=Marinobacterium marinum TaxID=2756129 RepID=A0A7W2AC27_9GAMM|nr:mechanosensitive ion channel domain-containing protein [Marinobacterium marinum]MBA4502049.1 mechanosensitive ion channel [Marinobacterium marinum]